MMRHGKRRLASIGVLIVSAAVPVLAIADDPVFKPSVPDRAIVPDSNTRGKVVPQGGPTAGKLGSLVTDQTYVPIAPCRIVDTRNVGGPIAAGTTRNFFFFTISGFYDWSNQGGSGGFSSGTCAGTLFSGVRPSAAAVTITVVSPSADGNWVLWGGAGPVPTVSALNWQAGEVAANTTVVPGGGRNGNGSGGPVLDFAVRFNGPTGVAHFVADVVGYFIENQGTALDCYETPLRGSLLAAHATWQTIVSAACSAGWKAVKGNCDVDVHDGNNKLKASQPVFEATLSRWSCDYSSGGIARTAYASSICCRVPGR